MENSQSDDADQIVEYKVRQRVAFKVMRDIHKQVNQIEQSEKSEHHAKRWILPLLLFIGLFIAALVLWPNFFRQLSAVIF